MLVSKGCAVHIPFGVLCPFSSGVLLNGKSHLFFMLLTCPVTLNTGYLLFAWAYSCVELSFTYFLVLV